MQSDNKRKKITAKYVIGFKDSSHCVYENGCVVYENDKILYVGPNNKKKYSKVETLVGGNKILSPGFVNLHCVSNIDIQTLLMKKNLTKIPKDEYWRIKNNLKDEFFEISAKYSVANILKGGSTTFCSVTSMAMKGYSDQIKQNWELIKETQKLGLRGYFANNFQDYCKFYKNDKKIYVYDKHEGKEGLEQAGNFSVAIKRLKDKRIKTFLFPYTLESCSDQLLRHTKELAEDLGLNIRMHAAQYKDDFQRNLQLSNKDPLKRLDSLGLLNKGLLITHAIYLSSGKSNAMLHHDHLKMLKENKVNICHCPKVYLRKGYGLNSLQKLINKRINVGIGTDTYPQDMLNELTCASYLTKLKDRSVKSGNPKDLFNIATIGGAKALGCNRIGRIKKGSFADMLLIDIGGLQSGIIDDPITTLVMNCNSTHIDTVIVNGKILMKDKKIENMDENNLIEEASRQWEIMKENISGYSKNNNSRKRLFSQWIKIKQ